MYSMWKSKQTYGISVTYHMNSRSINGSVRSKRANN